MWNYVELEGVVFNYCNLKIIFHVQYLKSLFGFKTFSTDGALKFTRILIMVIVMVHYEEVKINKI